MIQCNRPPELVAGVRYGRLDVGLLGPCPDRCARRRIPRRKIQQSCPSGSPLMPRALLSSSVAPTASVPVATQGQRKPNLSDDCVFDGLMHAWLHPRVPLRANTYAPPESHADSSCWLPFTPVAPLSSCGVNHGERVPIGAHRKCLHRRVGPRSLSGRLPPDSILSDIESQTPALLVKIHVRRLLTCANRAGVYHPAESRPDNKTRHYPVVHPFSYGSQKAKVKRPRSKGLCRAEHSTWPQLPPARP